jgi:hypothetical protein
MGKDGKMGVTRELARETWSEYFDALSKELLTRRYQSRSSAVQVHR